MTVLPQLKRDLQNAAEPTLGSAATSTVPRKRRGELRRAGLRVGHRTVPAVVSITVSIGVLVVAFLSLHAGISNHRGARAQHRDATGSSHIPNWRGSGPACRRQLENTPGVGEVAPAGAADSAFQLTMLDRGAVTWPAARSTKTFDTCPPKRALLIGDSIAFTIGVPYLANEQDYGMEISDAATLGCALGVKGELDVNGTWETPPPGCLHELSTWQKDATASAAHEIIVEIGFRDEFDWRWNGTVEHLGDPAFDSYIESRLRQLISVLGNDGRRKLLFLSVPNAAPPAQTDGQRSPAGSTVRHAEINRLIRQAADRDAGNAEVLNIDKVLSPDNTYATDVNGQRCRFGGSHVTVYCSRLLEPDILDAARALLQR